VSSTDEESPGSDAGLAVSKRGRKHAKTRSVGWREPLAVVGAWLLGSLVFFYAQWSSGFKRIMGNSGDTRLIVYLNEHWYLVLKGAEAWRSPPFFYPTKGVLGYTDTFFLWQPVYAPFRLFGADPFLAFQLSIVALSLLGFVSFVVLVRSIFSAPLPAAIVGAPVFTFANNLSQHAGSPQMFGIYFAPAIALVGLWSWRRRVRRPLVSVVLALCFGALCALFLFSTYYAAWLTLLSAGVVFVLAFLFGPKAMAVGCAAGLRSGWRTILGGLVGAAIGIIPFLMTYVPVLDQLGGRHYGRVLSSAPSVNYLWNVTPGNIFWRHLLGVHMAPPRPAAVGFSYAVTPVLLGTVIVGAVVLVWAVARRWVRLDPVVRLTLALCCASIVLAVLPVETSAGSLWSIVWHLPGATAIRAIARVEVANDLVTALALVGLITEAVRQWGRLRRSTILRTLGVAVLCVIIVEQAHTSVSTDLNRGAQNAVLASVPTPPIGCTSFFVVDSVRNSMKYYEYQTEAMVIAQHVGVPTINGYSGDTPPGWKLLYPTSPNYTAAVRAWVETNHLANGICRLDIGTMTWERHPGW
jgi:hypothetical protein